MPSPLSAAPLHARSHRCQPPAHRPAHRRPAHSVPLRPLLLLPVLLLLLSLSLSLSSPLPAAAQAGDGNAPVELKFGSFFRQPAGPRGLEMTPALQAANGRDVRIVGYMVAQEQPPAGRFLLTPRPVRVSEHADGDADDLPPATVTVLLDATQHDRIVRHQPGLLALTGRLLVGRAEDTATGRVSWVRLQLPPQAVAADPASANAANVRATSAPPLAAPAHNDNPR